MEISVNLCKLKNSKFFCGLLQFTNGNNSNTTNVDTILFPDQYSDVYHHYMWYLTSSHITTVPGYTLPIKYTESIKLVKRCFELYQYLDDSEYFKVVLQQYFDTLVSDNIIADLNIFGNRSCIIDNNDGGNSNNDNDGCGNGDCCGNGYGDDEYVFKDKLTMLNSRMLMFHNDVMSSLNSDLSREIQLHCPYLLLSQQDVDNKVLFDLWLSLNHDANYRFGNIILYTHVSLFYPNNQIKSFLPQYSIIGKTNLRFHGLHLAWYQNGNIERKTPYLFGECHGINRSWFIDTGLPSSEYSWRHGLPHGIYTIWRDHPDFIILETGYHIDGKREGLYRKWYSYNNIDDKQHQLKEECYYRKGKKHGLCREWLPDGKLKYECHYTHGY